MYSLLPKANGTFCVELMFLTIDIINSDFALLSKVWDITIPSYPAPCKPEFTFFTYSSEQIHSTRLEAERPFSIKKRRSDPNLKSHWSRIAFTPWERKSVASFNTHASCCASSCEYEMNTVGLSIFTPPLLHSSTWVAGGHEQFVIA